MGTNDAVAPLSDTEILRGISDTLHQILHCLQAALPVEFTAELSLTSAGPNLKGEAKVVAPAADEFTVRTWDGPIPAASIRTA